MTDYTYRDCKVDTVAVQAEIGHWDWSHAFVSITDTYPNTVLTFAGDLNDIEQEDLKTILQDYEDQSYKRLIAHIANYRWVRETSGIMSQGYGIDTADRSKVLINGAYNSIRALATPNALMDFKTAQGWVEMPHSTVEAIALEVSAHVEKCFHCERFVSEKIWLGEVTNESGTVVSFETEYASL